ncbi:MAG: permease, partial [Candidatus Peregrinibacteria bacterium]
MNLFQPFELLADAITYRVLALAPATHAGEAVHFFIADTLKIFLLLIVIIFVVTVIRTFVPPARIRALLSRRGK